ncbi:MAG: S49 family peptidase, partial [Gammaproteobacteria bacterium]|nr:S49 family peptidase [Gammaproteobacteria bacterium]
QQLQQPESEPRQEAAKSGQKALEDSKEWRLIRTLVKDIQQEQVRSRRWGILFKSLTFILLFGVLFGAWYGVDEGAVAQHEHVAVVEVLGPIISGAPASSEQIVPSLQAAFAEDYAQAIVLDINSPGGSPVQAGIIYDELHRLKAVYPDKTVYAVISDVGASGAYYIAAAADYIYADKASMVGSIGVIGSGFGFTELMHKVGVERRSYTAGDNKDFLDPFQTEKPGQRAAFEGLLKRVHQQFVRVVKAGRGARLADDPKLFSGAIWDGEQAVELGLVDGLGSIYSVSREHIGITELEVYQPAQTPVQQLLDEMGAQASTQLQAWLQTPRMQ